MSLPLAGGTGLATDMLVRTDAKHTQHLPCNSPPLQLGAQVLLSRDWSALPSKCCSSRVTSRALQMTQLSPAGGKALCAFGCCFFFGNNPHPSSRSPPQTPPVRLLQRTSYPQKGKAKPSAHHPSSIPEPHSTKPLYPALQREGRTDRPSVGLACQGAPRRGPAPLHHCLCFSPPAAQSKWTQQQWQRVGLVKINHFCKEEWSEKPVCLCHPTARANLLKLFITLFHLKVASPL